VKQPSEFRVGDYVRLIDDLSYAQSSYVYRVDKIKDNGRLVIVPVFGLFDSHTKRGYQYVSHVQIEKVSLLVLGLEFSKFTDLVNQVARHYGLETSEDPQKNSETPKDGDNE